MPIVSVIFPSKREDHFFDMALKSILNQTLEDIEIIFVDDNPDRKNFGPPDPRIKRIDGSEMEHNIFRLLNLGMMESTGDYLGVLSDDDLFIPETLEIMVGYADKSESDIVCSGWNDIDGDGYLLATYVLKGFDLDLYRRDNYLNSSAMLFRNIFLATNGIKFYEDFISMGDHAMFYDCIKHGAKVYTVSCPLMYMRRHRGQTSIKRLKERIDDYEKLRESFGEADLFCQKEVWLRKEVNAPANNQSV